MSSSGRAGGDRDDKNDKNDGVTGSRKKTARKGHQPASNERAGG